MTGSNVLATGARLGPAELGLLATVGASRVTVYKQPVVGLLSTGNELQDPEEDPDLKIGHIRDSNKTVLKALIQVRLCCICIYLWFHQCKEIM